MASGVRRRCGFSVRASPSLPATKSHTRVRRRSCSKSQTARAGWSGKCWNRTRACGERPMKLEFGGGKKPRGDGWVNVDQCQEADVIHNLNLRPWPFADDSAGEIYSSHCLEHL